MTLVTEGSTYDELGSPHTLYGGDVSIGSSNELLNECSSVVSAVSLDGDFDDPPSTSTTFNSRFTPLIPSWTTTWQYPNRGDAACKPLPNPHFKKNDSLYVKKFDVNGGWSNHSDCVTIVTAASTDDETRGLIHNPQ